MNNESKFPRCYIDTDGERRINRKLSSVLSGIIDNFAIRRAIINQGVKGVRMFERARAAIRESRGS